MATDPMWAAILAARDRLSETSSERFPAEERFPTAPGTDAALRPVENQRVRPTVPRFPEFPAKLGGPAQRPSNRETSVPADGWATWQERAAVREFDGHMSRLEAEVRTALELGPCPAVPASLWP